MKYAFNWVALGKTSLNLTRKISHFYVGLLTFFVFYIIKKTLVLVCVIFLQLTE